MAIIKYKDKDGTLQPLGATGDHSHSLESLGAAAKDHPHDVASIENNTDGFMSVSDKADINNLKDAVFGNTDTQIVGLVEKIGTDSVSAQISAAVANMVKKDGDKVLSDNNYTDDAKDKLGNIAPGAEVNQNAFTTITVDKTKIEANAKTDNITLTAGDNITFTPDTTSKTVTIAAADTTYKEATKDNAGLMSATDKAKLDTVTEGATKVVVDDALNDASANAIQNKVVTDEINDINTKFTNLVGTDSVSSQISNALNALTYAGSKDVGGSAISAEALTSKSVGDTAQPVYFNANGKPVACGHTINADVPEGAKFTDTTYSAGDGIALSDDNKFSNSGVRSVVSGDNNGTIKVNTNGTEVEVSVKGLGSAAYTSADAYDKAKAAEDALKNAKAHTDQKFTDLVGTTKVSEQISGALSSLKYAVSSDVGGAATSANKVNQSLTVKLNNGATEGTNKFTFNGSDAKTINITPSSIGAAANSVMTGATSTQNGASGLVPGPTSTNAGQFLRGDGSWATPTNTKNTAGTTSTTNTKLYLVGATSQGNTSAPTAQTYTNSGLYIDSSNNLYSNGKKVSVDGHNHDDIYYTDDEIDTMFSNKVGTDSVSSQISTAISNHSHKYAGSSTAGGAADEAKKVSNSLVVKLNNGTTANTDYFTFNGSSAKTINITPSSIGAATSGHNHSGTYATSGHNHDGTYATTSTFNTNSNGLVPYPGSSNTNKFLQGNGTWATPSTTYTLPVASSTTLGGIKVGSGLSISDGVLSATGGGVSSTNPTFTGYLSLNSSGTPAQYASTLGYGNAASGQCANASGNATVAGGYASITGGVDAVALGNSSSAIGQKTTAYGDQSHAEGKSSQSAYKYHSLTSVSAGQGVYSIWNDNFKTSVAFSAAVGTASHVEGIDCLAWSDYSHAEGFLNKAEGVASHAEGQYNKTDGACSHVEGARNQAQGYCQHVQGHFNSQKAGCSNFVSQDGTAFIIGNGTSYTAPSNAFRVDYNGTVYSNNTYMSTNADYAEYFEWQDSNPDAEDRRGYFVTLDGEQIKIAEPDDYILGIISGQPAVIGNGDEDWMGRYIRDDFGAFIFEEFECEEEIPETIIDEETGEAKIEIKTVTTTGIKYRENPDYDSSLPYIQRADRPEWDAVGMMGVLSVRDDGTCQVNGYCKVAAGGIATASESGYRVIKRINDHIVKVVFR